MSGVERANQDWQQFANCSTADPEIFFPEKGENASIRLARIVCDNCIVFDQCREDALIDPPSYGIRAGMTQRELQSAHRRVRPSRDERLEVKRAQAQALRDAGATLDEIAARLGYKSHGGVRHLLTRGPVSGRGGE